MGVRTGGKFLSSPLGIDNFHMGPVMEVLSNSEYLVAFKYLHTISWHAQDFSNHILEKKTEQSQECSVILINPMARVFNGEKAVYKNTCCSFFIVSVIKYQ